MKRRIILMLLVIGILFNKNVSFSQKQQVNQYSGPYKDGTAKYSYYEDINGNIILHGLFEYSYEQRDLDKDGKYSFNRNVVFKGEFKNGKKEGEWSYSYPIFNSNEAYAYGGGKAEIQITLDRDKITERNYKAKDDLPGDHYLVKIGQLVIKGNYLNGKLHGDFITTLITKATEYEKLVGKPPKFIKNKYSDKNESTLHFKEGLPIGKASIVFNGKPLLTGEFNSEGNFEGIWTYYSPSFIQNNEIKIIESLNFKNGFILSGKKVDINKNDTLINITNSDISNLLLNLDNSIGKDLGYHIGNKKKIDDEISTKLLPKFNELPIEKFQEFNDQLLELLSCVYLVSELDIDYYNKQYESVNCFNFNNFIITDENKVRNILGNPFDKIYREHIKAIGGEEAIKKITNYKIVKTIIKAKDPKNHDSEDEEFKLKGLTKYKSPDKYFLEVPEWFNFLNSIYFWNNGKKSFMEYDYNTIKATTPKDNDFFIFKTMIFPLYQMKEQGYKFELMENKYNQIVIQVNSPNDLRIDVYLDDATYLITKYEIYISPGRIDDHYFKVFKDIKVNYKENNGVLLPWIEKHGLFKYQYEYQLNVPISNSEFEAEYQIRPAQPKVDGWN